MKQHSAKPPVAVVKAKQPKKVTVVDELKTGKPVVHVVTDFSGFLREQGVIGLSIAIVLGAAVTKLVGAFVADIINPIIGVLVGAAGELSSFSLNIGPIEIMWGHFLVTLIDFLIVAAVVYVMVKILKLDRIDKKKQAATDLKK